MTRMLVCAAALTLLALGAGLVLAAEVNLQKLSAEEMKAVCEKAGTSFSEDKSCYVCGTDCKGGRGTDCTVFCPTSGKRCTAQVMGSRRPKTAGQALAPASKQKN